MKASDLQEGDTFKVNGTRYKVYRRHTPSKKMTHLTCTNKKGVVAVSMKDTLEVELIRRTQ